MSLNYDDTVTNLLIFIFSSSSCYNIRRGSFDTLIFMVDKEKEYERIRENIYGGQRKKS